MSERDTENSPLLEDPPEEKEPRICPLVTIIIFLSICLVGILFLVGFWKFEIAAKGDGPRNCMTPECITLASTLLNWQNRSVDPCDNFYEYACGKYQEHTLNDGTRINEKDRIVSKLIGSFIRKKEPTTSRSENALRLLYAACVESQQICSFCSLATVVFQNLLLTKDSIQKEVFQNIEKIGKWPTAHRDWNESDFDLNEMLTNMAKLHMLQFGFFETGIVEYPMNGSPKQVVIRPAISRFIVPRDELATTVMEILKLSGIERRQEELVEEVGECLELDKELGRCHVDPQADSVPLTQLDEALPEIDFERIIRTFLHPERGNWTSLKQRISSANFDSFFGKNRSISSIISGTPPRVLANYLILKYVEYSYFYYVPEIKTDADHCLEVVTAILPRASLRVFVRNHFKRENIRVASEMVEEVKEAFIEMIRNSTWLHVATREAAIRKVQKMKSLVGYTKEYEKEGTLDGMFETLNVSPEDSFFTLMTKINRFKTEQLMDYVTSDSLLNPIDSLVVANAYYYFTKNSLNVLIPFLDKPLFDFKYPRYVTMAGVGRVIAHEIGHAFDTIGRQTDEIGKVRDWWTPEDSKEYDHRVECFAGQFEDFVEKNATDVLPEIIADALGIEATWIAFKKLDLSNEETLIEFGHHDFKKLFFEIAALDFCSRNDKPMFRWSHPPNRFRVNSVFGNSPSFSETFGCPVGSPMNSEKKCRMF